MLRNAPEDAKSKQAVQRDYGPIYNKGRHIDSDVNIIYLLSKWISFPDYFYCKPQ